MNEHLNRLSDLFAACWKDEALKARFLSNPREVLKEYGLEYHDHLEVNVVENTDDCVHITLPFPPDGKTDLTDEEIMAAAGGVSCYNIEKCTST